MKLAVLIAALCTASCTAINLAAERPKPQLQRANKALALRGGGLAQDITQETQKLCNSRAKIGSLFSYQRIRLFAHCFEASDGLLMVFFWGMLYVIGTLNILPGKYGKKIQHFFEQIYKPKYGELGYIRFEILWILGSLANTAVLWANLGNSAKALLYTAVVWATTLTLVVIKFYFEHKAKLIADETTYKVAQALHAFFALTVWYGVKQSWHGVFTSK